MHFPLPDAKISSFFFFLIIYFRNKYLCQINHHLGYCFPVPSQPQTICSYSRTPSQRKKIFHTLRRNQESRSCYARGASLLEMKGRSYLHIFGSTYSEVKVKADILVSIWLIFHAKTSCCHRTNSKRKG